MWYNQNSNNSLSDFSNEQEIYMLFLEDTKRNKGSVYPGNILKVDSFLKHRLDISVLDRLGEEFARRFAEKNFTMILTIEASGIAVACSAARYMNVPVVFAKKSRSLNIPKDVYSSKVYSYTHKTENNIVVSAQFTVGLLLELTLPKEKKKKETAEK